MSKRSMAARALTVGIAAVLFLSGCSSDKIVYRDRAPFNPPPDSVNGFLGLFTIATNQTTCGNCHVGHQRDWSTSAHSGAYAHPRQLRARGPELLRVPHGERARQ